MRESRTNNVSKVRGIVEGKNLARVIKTMTFENGYYLDKVLCIGEKGFWVVFSKEI